MSIKLNLKKRPLTGSITISLEWIKGVFRGEDPANQLLAQVEGMIDGRLELHDKNWLMQIINWTPPGGQSLTEAAKWFKLAKRIVDLDEDKEGTLTLSDYQVNLIWSRLIDPDYKITGLPSAFVEFIMEFQQASGRHFPEEEPDEIEGAD